MSTFDGKVKEFPDIRIDHFRLSSEASRPPLAYFLSHVHSDHLLGLESCKSPFIYCSPATKEIILRLEKYPHRMNFAKGILETRKQTYRHLKKLLKTIPLETPTVIDLAPGRSIRVTLFDANHCVGAVSFLIEGGGKAILYTGDVRSESWWVEHLSRHPLMLAYTSSGSKKPLKRLDCVYLDTTFATKDNPYKHFPSKAQGISELLHQVEERPKDTLFYFDTWTFGYEDVWMALCSFLECQVHVDDYRYKLYRALATGEEPRAPEAARLFGYKFGNHMQEGCLTRNQSRLHSCEQGTGCEIFKQDFVRITPIISRHDGVEMPELGAGGGQGDLDQQHELEVGDTSALGMLMSLCATKLQDQPILLSSVLEMLASMVKDPVHAIALDPSIFQTDAPGLNQEDVDEPEDVPLESLVPALTAIVSEAKGPGVKANAPEDPNNLPKRITFPYSRHSSYTELCHLIEAFKPLDIHPCTVDKANWSASQSMAFLFGHLYDRPCKFTHDQTMFRRTSGDVTPVVADSRPASPPAKSRPEDRALDRTANGAALFENDATDPSTRSLHEPSNQRVPSANENATRPSPTAIPELFEVSKPDPTTSEPNDQPSRKRRRQSPDLEPTPYRPSGSSPGQNGRVAAMPIDFSNPAGSESAPLLSPNEYTAAWQREAFDAALGTGPADWNQITLTSVAGHQEREKEL